VREPGQIKRAPRVDTRFNTRLTDSDGVTINVVVIDISREGCRLEADGSLRIGEKVQIEVPKHGSFAAQIRWALGNEAGAVFLEPVFLD
jgi:PilZ domain